MATTRTNSEPAFLPLKRLRLCSQIASVLNLTIREFATIFAFTPISMSAGHVYRSYKTCASDGMSHATRGKCSRYASASQPSSAMSAFCPWLGSALSSSSYLMSVSASPKFSARTTPRLPSYHLFTYNPNAPIPPHQHPRQSVTASAPAATHSHN